MATDCEKLKLIGANRDLASELVLVLKPLQAVTTALSLEQNLSISMVMPIVTGLKQRIAPKDNDCGEIKRFKQHVKDPSVRFLVTDTVEDCRVHMTWLAAAVDPRFKTLIFG